MLSLTLRQWSAIIVLVSGVFLPAGMRSAAASSASAPTDLPTLRPGDIILIDLGCYVCRMINATTGSPFNHSGLVVKKTDEGTIYVAQSLDRVETIPLENFLSQAKKGSPLMVRRAHELNTLFQDAPDRFEALAQQLEYTFEKHFRGRGFDGAFLWNNYDEHDEELLYCSEMIQKTLNHILETKLSPMPMDFSREIDFWTRYFGGHVPQGELGNSPASLQKSPLLETVWDSPL